MALVKLGGLAQDVRGTLNGSVFSRNRGGAYIRSKVSPVQPVSEWSSRVRATFKAAAQRWATELDDYQRSAWIAFAAVHPFVNVFGDAIILSGIAMYEAINQRLRLAGEEWIDEPPLTFVVEDIGAVTLMLTGTGGDPASATIACQRVLTYDEGLYVFFTVPFTGGRRPQKSDYRLINTNLTLLFDSGESLVTALVARFVGQGWDVGQKISVMVAAMNRLTGAMSAAVTVNGEVE